MLSKFNGTSTPKGSYRAKTGDNDCNANSSRYRLSTALCESIRYQAKSEQNVRQDLIPRVRHGEAAISGTFRDSQFSWANMTSLKMYLHRTPSESAVHIVKVSASVVLSLSYINTDL